MRTAQPCLARALHLPDGERVTLRPIGPRDASVLQSYVRGLSPESRYDRFFGALFELPPAELDRVTHLDRKYELALLAETHAHGAPVAIGEARYALAVDRLEGEFALSVADDWRGKGLGTLLMTDIECRARSLGAVHLFADVLRSNEPMKALARKNGFRMADVPRDGRLVCIVKDLAHSRGLYDTADRSVSNLYAALKSRAGDDGSSRQARLCVPWLLCGVSVWGHRDLAPEAVIGRSKDNYCGSKPAILHSLQSRQRK
jgi:GNAT superfamily N-acetyltransferase